MLGLAGANAQQVVEGAQEARRDPADLPGVTPNVFYDRAELVSKAVGAVSSALLEATVIVVVLLVLPGTCARLHRHLAAGGVDHHHARLQYVGQS